MFLDEIGDLPLSTQVKLLRVLEENEIEKVGDHNPIPIDVRILTATNKDLERLVEEERFRDDLYYRVAFIPIYLPSLRVRREDIPLLVDAFINRLRLKSRKPINGMDKKAFGLLMEYDWPGNVRELINVIEYTFVLCPGGEIVPDHLPTTLTTKPHPLSAEQPKAREHRRSADEKKRLLKALKRTGGNKSEAARIIGIGRVTLWKRLKAYDIHVDKRIQE